MIQPKKPCKQCGNEKPLYDYGRHKHMLDGLNSRCRDCVAANRTETELERLRKRVTKADGYWNPNGF